MIKAHSLLVTLAIFLSTFTRIYFMSTFFSRGILLVATESYQQTDNKPLIVKQWIDGTKAMTTSWAVAHQS